MQVRMHEAITPAGVPSGNLALLGDTQPIRQLNGDADRQHCIYAPRFVAYVFIFELRDIIVKNRTEQTVGAVLEDGIKYFKMRGQSATGYPGLHPVPRTPS